MGSLDFMFAILTVALIVVAAAAVAGMYRRHVPAGKARIQVIAVYLSAGDNLLDVRYRVTRPGHVLPLDEITIQGANGQPATRVASVARIGRLASRSALHRTGGFVLFRNVGSVAHGDLVTVAVGRRQEAFHVT